jgi:hypothetical protein|tara:strand:+ start:2278 stop:2625 length:348 start_codon:yes stop_codon:yes gene_type:complete
LTSSEFGHIIILVKLKKERYNMTNKTFKFVGSSLFNGKTKLRFANDIMRIKVLDKNGHQDVDFKELPTDMDKASAVAHLSSIGFGGENTGIQGALKKAAKKYGKPVVATAEVEVA